MAHSTYENWILNDVQLSCHQVQELKEHLKVCSDCAFLYSNWKSVDTALKNTSMVSPLPGFSARWQAGLQKRQLRQQREQVNLFFFIIGGANILAILMFIGFILSNNLWFNLLIDGLQEITSFIIWIVQLKQILISLLLILPPFLSISLWLLFTTCLSIITLIWAASIWRIVFQGVKTK